MDEEFADELLNEQETPKTDVGREISADLIRGHINTIILRTLGERDKYGYEIIDEIEKKSHGQYSLKQPTLYSALKRLETQGYIKAYWKSDEVSSGGRRKYFMLTDLGREFSEKNQSEWEYSRTVIDSLISDKPFDFSKSAPSEIDFNILKKSVTRVPTGGKSDTDLTNVKQQDNGRIADDYPSAYVETVETSHVKSEYSQQTTTEIVIGQTEGSEKSDAPAADTRTEEEKRTAHENFLKLISEPAPMSKSVKPTDENIVPHSEEIDTEKLIYNNKPETERDYKKLVNNIFNKAVKYNSTPMGQSVAQSDFSQRQYVQTQRTDAVVEKGKADGLKVNTSTRSTARTGNSESATYCLGTTLFLSSAIVGILFLAEFILCLLLKEQLNISSIYPFVILAIGIAQFAIFGIIALGGYGKNSAKPTQHNYVAVSIILTIIAILIICLTGFLLNVNVHSLSDVMTKLVIPSIVALNIPLFTVTFYILVSRK